MFDHPRSTRRVRLGALAGLSCAALAGCGSSAGPTSTSIGMAGMKMSSTARSTTTNPAATGTGGRTTAGMTMGRQTARADRVDGITPIPSQLLGNASWQEMRITAMAMTAVPFVIDDGTKEQMVKPPRNVSFHLMVKLNDARTDYPIPYAGVWATIRRAGKVVFDERQWPMLSEYIGPHYGNNVSLPGPGTYRLTLLISPPVAARHLEYQNVWLHPHRVSFTFNWRPGS